MTREIGEPLPLRIYCQQEGCDFTCLLHLPIFYFTELINVIERGDEAINEILEHHDVSREGEIDSGFHGHDQLEAFDDETGARFAGLLVSSYAVVMCYDLDYETESAHSE